MPRPRVFLDVQHGTLPLGRITIELFPEHAPKACENFRNLCTNSKPAHTLPSGRKVDLHYQGCTFHRAIPEFMIQGGDITAGNGTGGASTFKDGAAFEDENLGWRRLDKEGLVCMANRGPGTNTSQFFITLDETDYLTAKHTCFGHVVAGMDVVHKIADVPVGETDKPVEPVLISTCGELEFRKKATAAAEDEKKQLPETILRDGRITKPAAPPAAPVDGAEPPPPPSRDTHSRSHSRSRTPERGRERKRRRTSTSRTPTSRDRRHRHGHRHHHHHHHHRRRRRSQSRSRSRSPSFSPKRGRSPRKRTRSPHSRTWERERAWRRHDRYDRYDPEEEARIYREEREREGGRLDAPIDGDGGGQGAIRFKGRGAMRYRERKQWGGGGGEWGRLN